MGLLSGFHRPGNLVTYAVTTGTSTPVAYRRGPERKRHGPMNAVQFVDKWCQAGLTERSGSHEHFIDLCRVVGHPTPGEADTTGTEFTFERRVAKANGRRGWADVWKRDFFAWEYKSPDKNLEAAHDQLRQYREALLNPPLLAACDMRQLVIRTNFTRKPTRELVVPLDGLSDPRHLRTVEHLFFEPDRFDPGLTVESITAKAAGELAEIAQRMRGRGLDPTHVARFLDRVVFCFFAQDVRLLGERLFSRIIEKTHRDPRWISGEIFDFFRKMATGGTYALERIPHFNGNLFADIEPLELTGPEIDAIHKVARLDWGDVDASIFGTLFERGMDPAKRSEMGAHYTSREDIETLIDPVVMRPLRLEWDHVRGKIDATIPVGGKNPTRVRASTRKGDPAHIKKARSLVSDFLQRLQDVTVLDPACGSGNFLYVALQKLKDLEKEVLVYASGRNIDDFLPRVGPWQLRGIEKSPYAFDLARMTIWIGWLQWTRANGYQVDQEPILRALDNLQNVDAILDLSDPANPREPDWPAAEFVIGNPPFLGNKRMRSELGESYCEQLWKLYRDRIPATSDLCCYWLEKARAGVGAGVCSAAGLLATTAVKQVSGRRVLDRIGQTARIFFAESDRDWVLGGASIRICMVGFAPKSRTTQALLNGRECAHINPDLTSGPDRTKKMPIRANLGLCFMGTTKVGDFDIPLDLALRFLAEPNPHGRPNSDVLRPFRNGSDLVRVCSHRWVIDFGVSAPEHEAALYAAPFEHLSRHVKPARRANGRAAYRERWWIHGEARPGFRRAVAGLTHYVATARVAKHRIFVRLDSVVLPDSKVIAVARDDDYSLGVLQSRVHELWTLNSCGWHGVGNDATYNPTTCFETFPFPDPFEALREEIAGAARKLRGAREAWLNPPEWTREELMEFPGSVSGPWSYFVHGPDGDGVGTVRYSRPVPRDAACAAAMADRTLTNLYNKRPAWLDLAHRRLDEAVAAAYGWKADLPDDEILSRLLTLNAERAAKDLPIGHTVTAKTSAVTHPE